jgi:RNA polymerase sigma-70 factor, ECF subfamily
MLQQSMNLELFVKHERDAIQQMKRGNIAGLELLVEKYQARAFRTAVLISRDAALAEDIVQSSFINAWRKIHQFDASKAFEPWFMKSVVNNALQALRKNQRFSSLDNEEENPIEEWLDEKSIAPQEAVEAHEQREMIREALEKLSPEQRAVIVMRYYLEMGEAEMAETLNIPAGTIKWRLHEARRRLRGLLQFAELLELAL